jgi:hypothetical protein
MLKWLWNRKAQEPKKELPEKKQEQPLACPSCNAWASKETLDGAHVTHARDDLTCEKCGASNLLLGWAHTGRQKEIMRGLQEMVDRSTKPPPSN